MKLPRVEDIWVPPCDQVLLLVCLQRWMRPLCDLSRIWWVAEGVKVANTIGRKVVEGWRRRGENQCEKAAKRVERQMRKVEGLMGFCELRQGIFQVFGTRAFCQFERRLQRGVKAVTPRRLCSRSPGLKRD